MDLILIYLLTIASVPTIIQYILDVEKVGIRSEEDKLIHAVYTSIIILISLSTLTFLMKDLDQVFFNYLITLMVLVIMSFSFAALNVFNKGSKSLNLMIILFANIFMIIGLYIMLWM